MAARGEGCVGERGGLGGGDEGGLVIGSADCTATGSMGATCAGTGLKRGLDVASTAKGAGKLTKLASLAARSHKREVAASSRAR